MSAQTPATPTPPEFANEAATPPAAPSSASPAQPQTVTIPLEQLQTFTSVQARLAQLEAEQRSRDEAARAEQVKLLAAKGEIENALRIQREEAQKAPRHRAFLACRGRRACQAIRARWRSLASAGVAAPGAGGRRAAHAALAQSVCRRTAR